MTNTIAQNIAGEVNEKVSPLGPGSESRGNFLQSPEWRVFQESVGRKTYHVSTDGFNASLIEHALPLVGKYFYVPHGPVVPNYKLQITNSKETPNSKLQIQNGIAKIIDLAKKNKAGWIRVEPESQGILELIGNYVETNGINLKMKKAPHDMQPKETLILDLEKTEEELLKDMKPKTRYNIRLAEKKGVKIFNFQFSIFNEFSNPKLSKENIKYIQDFIRLTRVMAKRQGIATHEGEYYKKMFESLPGDMLKLYVAEYEGRVLAANLVIFYGSRCTYLHGASDNFDRNIMAPYLMQWHQIKDAKVLGCKKYDFFGVKVKNQTGRSWEGVTRFKRGFAPNVEITEYPGCYDLVINPIRYAAYRNIQKLKDFIRFR